MGFLDKARDAIGKNRDKIDQGMQKAAKLAKEKAGTQHAGKIDRIVEKGKDALDRMDDPQPDPGTPPGQPTSPSQTTPPDQPTPPSPQP
jgi:hypothetical protein